MQNLHLDSFSSSPVAKKEHPLLEHPFLLSSRCAQQKASLNGALDALANSGQWVWVPGWDGRF